jgi:ABC-type glycerol-3-phosphate transport system substrate-binding protein
VSVTLYSRVDEEEAFTKRVADLRQKHPRIQLDYMPLAGNYYDVIRTHAAGGTLADVVYNQSLLFESLAVGGSLQPIDKLVQRDKVNLKQWYDQGIQALKMDGKLFGLPARGQLGRCFLFLNRDAFGRAGVREPTDTWTLDDLVSAAEKLTVRDGSKYGFNTVWGRFQDTQAAFRRFGGDLLSADGKRCVADSPQALQAVQWHWDLWHRREVMPVKAFANADFGNGSVAMVGQQLVSARSGLGTAVKDAFKWTMVTMPKGPTGVFGADLSVAPVGLNSQTKALDAGWQVLQWLSDKETGIALALQTRGSNAPGMRRDVYCDERLLNDPVYGREMMDRMCKAMEQHAGTVTYNVPANYRQTEVEAIVLKHMNDVRDNKTPPSATTMRAMTTEIQAALNLPR